MLNMPIFVTREPLMTVPLMKAKRDDLIILTAWLAANGYDADTVAEAVRKPWNWLEELGDAKAELTGRSS